MVADIPIPGELPLMMLVLKTANHNNTHSHRLRGTKQKPYLAWCTILCAIKFLEQLGRYRTTGVMEVAIAQHVIPDREVLDTEFFATRRRSSEISVVPSIDLSVCNDAARENHFPFS